MPRRSYAATEAAWNALEDDLPRQVVLSFHTFLRDNEISAGRTFSVPERLTCLKAWLIHYPSLNPILTRHTTSGIFASWCKYAH